MACSEITILAFQGSNGVRLYERLRAVQASDPEEPVPEFNVNADQRTDLDRLFTALGQQVNDFHNYYSARFIDNDSVAHDGMAVVGPYIKELLDMDVLMGALGKFACLAISVPPEFDISPLRRGLRRRFLQEGSVRHLYVNLMMALQAAHGRPVTIVAVARVMGSTWEISEEDGCLGAILSGKFDR